MRLPKTLKPSAEAKDNTSDAFLGGRISVLQPGKGHRSGSDAVWLQAAVPARRGEKVLDAGAGVGVAGLCLLARVPGSVVTAVDIDPELCALAEANGARNGFAERFTAIEADVTAPQNVLCAKGLVAEGYDHVMANPPYYDEGSGAYLRPASASAHVMSKGRHGGLAPLLRRHGGTKRSRHLDSSSGAACRICPFSTAASAA